MDIQFIKKWKLRIIPFETFQFNSLYMIHGNLIMQKMDGILFKF